MKAFKLIAGFSIVMIFTSGCMMFNRKVSCSEFDNDIFEWLPYQSGNEIQLINAASDSIITLSINDVTLEHRTDYHTLEKCGHCDDQIIINIDDYNGEFFHVIIDLSENIVRAQSFIIRSTHFDEYYSSYQVLQNYLFEGTEYEEVKIFENEESSDVFIKLIMAKGIGIVGLIDTQGGVWELLDSSYLERPNHSFEIVSTTC